MAFDKLGRFFGMNGNDEDIPEDEETEMMDDPSVDEIPTNERRGNVVPINSAGIPTSKIVLEEPRVYSDAKEVSQNLLANKAVIINFARMDDAQARRIVDFVTGTVYALNGEIQRVGDKIFLATPPKFETDGKIAELVEKKDNLE